MDAYSAELVNKEGFGLGGWFLRLTGTVDGQNKFGRGMLYVVGCFVTKFCESTGNVIGHQYINVDGIMATINIQDIVQCVGPVNVKLVMGLDGANEVLIVGFGETFYSKIVNAKDERGAFGAVTP